MTLAQLGFDLRRLGKVEMQEFLRLIGMNIYDELTERFDSKLLKGALSLDATLGTHLGPRSPNTILTYLYRLVGSHVENLVAGFWNERRAGDSRCHVADITECSSLLAGPEDRQ